MSKRMFRALTVTVVAIALMGGGVAQAEPSHAARTKTIQVVAQYTEPEGHYDGARCWGLVAVTPECKLRYIGTASFTGTLFGPEHYDLYGLATPDGRITYEGTAYFSGGITGCGAGSYIIDVEDGYIDMTRFDPLTNSAPGHNNWRVRPGSGTGELTNLVSGQGVTNWTAYFAGKPGSPETFGEGDFTGSITCGR